MCDAERNPVQEEPGTSGADEKPQPGAGQTELEKQMRVNAELNEKLLRLAADFENFRKRTDRERLSVVALANERFAVDLLEVVDNFDRALKSDDAHLREGLMQIRQLFSTQLERHGIIPVDALNRPFNPAEHDAIAHVPSDQPEGTVIDEVSRGYRMHEKIIRHAKVAVSKGKSS
ncbi:MAG: nucleotide exchange factor GrpE [Methanomicrobiales archaeon]|nr:nucleotide exchange factor GrpE [Methanomicrobiales archaeon]